MVATESRRTFGLDATQTPLDLLPAIGMYTRAWTFYVEQVATASGAFEEDGRPRVKVRVAPDAEAPQAARQVVTPETPWERFAVAEGKKGPRLYDRSPTRVVE